MNYNMREYTKAILQTALIAFLGFVFFGNTAFASIVLQNYGSFSGGSNIGYDFPQYGNGFRFVATSTFDIGSIDYYMRSTNPQAGLGCARAYIYDTLSIVSTVPNERIATSTECIYPENLTSTFATTTYSFPLTTIASGTQYVITQEIEGDLGISGSILSAIGSDNPFGNTRGGLFNSGWTLNSSNGIRFTAYDTGFTPPSATNTRIISFTPENGTTTGNYVYFSIESFVSSDDVGEIQEVEVKLHNIDQNALISSFSDYDIILYKVDVTTSGYYNFATTTYLPDGNYRIDASMRSNVFGLNFGDVIIYETHQFVVNEQTFIGNISQNSFNALSAIFGSTTATTTQALANQCKPFVDWDTIGCLAFLFIPDAGLLADSISNTFDKIKVTFPLGYVTRFVAIVSDDNIVPLPDFTAQFLTGESATNTLTFSPSEMLAGANTVLTETRDPFNGKNLRDITEPIVQVVFALLVLLYIVTDLTTKVHHDGQIWSDPEHTEKIKGLRRIR